MSNPYEKIIQGAIDNNALAVKQSVEQILADKITDRIEQIKVETAQSMFPDDGRPKADDSDQEELDLEDDEPELEDEDDLEDFDDSDFEGLEDDSEEEVVEEDTEEVVEEGVISNLKNRLTGKRSLVKTGLGLKARHNYDAAESHIDNAKLARKSGYPGSSRIFQNKATKHLTVGASAERKYRDLSKTKNYFKGKKD